MEKNPAADPLYRDVTRAAWLGLGVNLALGVVKLTAGLSGDSVALISDSVNSLGDAVATIVVLFALRVAQMPADDEHPYGHTRAEGIAASNVALVIILSALLVGWEAIGHFGQHREMPPIWTLWIAGFNVVIKEGMYRYKLAVGRRTGSQSIIANAWDHRADALCSSAVLLGLLMVRWGGTSWIWVDQAAALVVVTAIVVTGVRLFRQSASDLMDVQASSQLVDAIRGTARGVEGVADVEKLWVRKSGLEYFADIHIQVDSQMTVAQGHKIGHLVQDCILETYPAMRGVLVHLEPHPHSHAQAE